MRRTNRLIEGPVEGTHDRRLVGRTSINFGVMRNGEGMLDLNVEAAIFDGQVPDGSDIIRIERVYIGDLKILTGKIVACDPMTYQTPNPFLFQSPTGQFPVELCVAHFPEGGELVGAAMIRFNDARPKNWKMATHKGEDLSCLPFDKIYGYGVDSGIGSFMDAQTAIVLNEHVNDDQYFYDKMSEELGKNYVPTRSWGIIRPNDGKESIAMFSSGYGDGSYASFWGTGENGRLECLVTDFGVLCVPV